MSDWLDFNGDGKVDIGEEFVGYQIYKDMNSDSGVFSGGRAGDNLTDGVVNFLVYVIVLVPFFLLIAFIAWLSKQDNIGASVFMLIIVLALVAWVVKVNVKESKRKAKSNELRDRAWSIVKDDVYSDEEIREHAKIWLVLHREKEFAYRKDPNAFRNEIEMDLRRNKQSGVWCKLMKEEGVPFM